METENQSLYKGAITDYIIEKTYGFIETPTGERFFFFINKGNLSAKELKLLHKFRNGDEVEFKGKIDSNNNRIAYDLHYLRNPKRDIVIEEAKQLNVLKGYLKKNDNSYYIKHLSTYLLIPIKVSPWETDLDIVYEARLNQLVTFHLLNLDKPFKINATITDRILKPEYSVITEIKNSNATTFATITGVNNDGYFTTLLNGSVKSFIRFKSIPLNRNDDKFSIGDIVEVKIALLSPENSQVGLILVPENEDNESSANKIFTFKNECFGNSVIERMKVTRLQRTHGIVVNALATQLVSLNYNIGNDNNRDLIIHNNNEILSIFEIKTSASTQSIYTAVGQLLIYSISIPTIKALFIVLPDLLKPKIKERLNSLNIKPIYYSWHNEEPTFHNLDLLKRLSV